MIAIIGQPAIYQTGGAGMALPNKEVRRPVMHGFNVGCDLLFESYLTARPQPWRESINAINRPPWP